VPADDDNDFLRYVVRTLIAAAPADRHVFRALEVQWRLRWGGQRHYIARRSPADRAESLRRRAAGRQAR